MGVSIRPRTFSLSINIDVKNQEGGRYIIHIHFYILKISPMLYNVLYFFIGREMKFLN